MANPSPCGVNVNIETLDDLRRALGKMGYSDEAIAEIIKWYDSIQ